jgi:hypothetical protein
MLYLASDYVDLAGRATLVRASAVDRFERRQARLGRGSGGGPTGRRSVSWNSDLTISGFGYGNCLSGWLQWLLRTAAGERAQHLLFRFMMLWRRDQSACV